MNDSSGNHTNYDSWETCISQGYVGGFCFLLGTPAVISILWTSLSGSLSGGFKPSLVFPINMCAVELVSCVVGLLYMISVILVPQNAMLQLIVYLLFYFAWICRPMVQSCYCVELYLAVAQPVAFLKYRQWRYRVACSTVVWVLSLAWTVLAVLVICNIFILAYVLVGIYCIGLVIMSLCCFSILRVLKQPGPGEVEGGRGGEKKQGTTDLQKRRAFGIIVPNMVFISLSSVLVVIVFSKQIFVLHFLCSGLPMLMTVNLFSVMVSPLIQLWRHGIFLYRRGPQTNDI